MSSDADGIATASTIGASSVAAGMRLYVVGANGVASYPLPATGSLTIGRGGDCDVPVDDTSVSRLHAVLHIGATLEIEDRGSHNGTRIGERRVAERRPVLPGEVVHLGSATLVIHDPAPPRSRHLWPHGYFEILVDQECARAAATARPFAVLRIRASEVAGAELAIDAIHQVLRDIDVLGSYAPDEYEVLLVEVDAVEARGLADRIAESLRARGVIARIGMAAHPRDGRDPASLIARAGARLDGEPADERAVRPSPSTIDQVRAVAERVANAQIGVLILGETGVGKEVMARTLHASSQRAEKPFVPIHCAGLSAPLFESEVFGHDKGAFTGAVAAKPGLLEIADGGTVFLDEVGELAEAIQVKLLRVLEDRVVWRVGATKPHQLDVRFVAATHRDLEHEVARGTFRADLFFRLNGVTLVVPPLRHRSGEIEELARGFCEEAAVRVGRSPPALSPAALAALESYPWPGNIRELRNAIERATVLCDGEVIDADDLPLDKMAATVRPARRPAPAPAIDDAAEKARLVEALAACNGNQTRAATLLGYSLRKLVYQMTRYELPRPRKRNRAP